MQIIIKRFEFGTNYTVGNVFVNSQRICFSLEREVNATGQRKPAIPLGTYKLTRDFSNRFQTMMPHILDVSGYTGIRIHPGNTDADTEGCILLGETWAGTDFIGNSHKVFVPFDFNLKQALAAGEECTIEVCDAIKAG